MLELTYRPSYGDAHFSLFLRKVFIKAAGYGEDALSRPLIGIINTGSGFNPCHANVPQLIEAVKRGIQLHGGLAIDFPTISLHEMFTAPTSMYLRNLMAMDTEEMIKAQPLDACERSAHLPLGSKKVVVAASPALSSPRCSKQRQVACTFPCGDGERLAVLV